MKKKGLEAGMGDHGRIRRVAGGPGKALWWVELRAGGGGACLETNAKSLWSVVYHGLFWPPLVLLLRHSLALGLGVSVGNLGGGQ